MPRDPESTPTPRRPRSLFERNYRRLEDIIGRPLPDLQSDIAYRLRADGLSSRPGGVTAPGPL